MVYPDPLSGAATGICFFGSKPGIMGLLIFRRMDMKHMRAISGTPLKAQTITAGSVIGILSKIIGILGAFVVQKEASQVQDY
jgi:hypothetical protein